MSVSKTGVPRRLLVEGDFILLKMAVVDALDGDFEAAIVLQRIAWRCERYGEWAATHEQIQAETRLSEWKVKKALRTLRAKGWLGSRRSSRADATQVWYLPPGTEESSVPGSGISPEETEESSISETEDSSVSSLEDVETNYETKTPAADAPVLDLDLPEPSSTAVAQGKDWFDEFWLAYPRKAGKQAARKAWERAVRKEHGARIVEGARRLRDDPNRVPQFTPHPQTWLNQGRWEDEPLPARSNGKPTIDDRLAEAARLDQQYAMEEQDPWAPSSHMIEGGY